MTWYSDTNYIDIEKVYDALVKPLNDSYQDLQNISISGNIKSKIADEKIKWHGEVLIKAGQKFDKLITKEEKENKIVSGKTAFKLRDTYGTPLEQTINIAKEQNMTVDIEKYNELFKEHQEK